MKQFKDEDCKLFMAHGSCRLAINVAIDTRAKKPTHFKRQCHSPTLDPIQWYRSTTLLYKVWEDKLPLDFPNRQFILDGVHYGFHIVDASLIMNQVRVDVKNYKSATDPTLHDTVERKLYKELANGHYVIVSDQHHIRHWSDTKKR